MSNKFSEQLRKQIYNKFNGHCAYCGKKIKFKEMQVDHLIPLKKRDSYNGNINDINNLMPTCWICNHYKRALSLEDFRKEWLGKLHLRIKKIPKNPRTEKSKKRKKYIETILKNYNISENKPFDGLFYFEKLGDKNEQNKK